MDNIASAWQSIWSNKIRSVLTVLGVVIGVTSVTTLVSLGQGLKNDVSDQIAGFGTNVITVFSGKIGSGGSHNPANFIAGDILTLEDVASIEKMSEVGEVTPVSIVPGQLVVADKSFAPTILGLYPNYLDAFKVLQFDRGEKIVAKNQGDVIILGPMPAQELFGGNDPVGQFVALGTRKLKVIGLLKAAVGSGVFGSQFDDVSIIPFDTATSLNKGSVKIFRIVAKADDLADVEKVKKNIASALLTNHNGEENFSVLAQEDLLGLFNTFVNLATTMVSAIAAISLVVGGIGIMNIMLVTVTERTREIGLRKAIGATKSAILIQFLTEAVVITGVGAGIGLLISLGVGTLIATKTDLTPEVTGSVVGLAAGVSVVIGVIFGLWPAIRAANKDPIEALRYE